VTEGQCQYVDNVAGVHEALTSEVQDLCLG